MLATIFLCFTGIHFFVKTYDRLRNVCLECVAFLGILMGIHVYERKFMCLCPRFIPRTVLNKKPKLSSF